MARCSTDRSWPLPSCCIDLPFVPPVWGDWNSKRLPKCWSCKTNQLRKLTWPTVFSFEVRPLTYSIGDASHPARAAEQAGLTVQKSARDTHGHCYPEPQRQLVLIWQPMLILQSSYTKTG
eukprot:s2043_g13.t1